MNNKTYTILVVDDNSTNLHFLFDLLDDAGFKVLISQDGKSAIRTVKTTRPDIILLDIMMPVMDGFATCQQLKDNEKTKEIPIIFMTALSDKVNKVKGFNLGAVDYITKPIEPEEVLARINTHLTITQLQKDLQNKNEELKKSLEYEKELNELKTRFISMVSHEFRTPLSVILIVNQILERYDEKISIKDRKKRFNQIRTAVNRMNILLSEVLFIGKSEANKLKCVLLPLDLKTFCNDIINDIKMTIGNKHNIIFSYTGASTNVSMDEKLLQHIITNLLTNAIKYSAKSSTINFDVQYENNLVIFQIKDEGIGIPEEDLKRLFEAFHRASNVANISGTGLGLTILKKAVECHNGVIEVDSKINYGTTFKITIPIKEILQNRLEINGE